MNCARALVASLLLLPTLSARQDEAQVVRALRIDPSTNPGTNVVSVAPLTETVAAQQRSWRRLLAGLKIGQDAPAAAPVVETTPALPVAVSAPAPIPASGTAKTLVASAGPTAPDQAARPMEPAEPAGPVGRAVERPVDSPLPGMVSVRLPVDSAEGPLVVARTPRREVQPGRSGTLRLSSAPTGLAPLATGTVRRLMSGTNRLPLPLMVAASTRPNAPVLAAPVTAAAPAATPATTPVATPVATPPALREDGLASSLTDCEILCSEAPVWNLPGASPDADPRHHELIDGRFRPPDAPPTQLPSLVDLGFAADPTREPDTRGSLNWFWDEETLIRFESLTDEDNPFEGAGRTWVFTVFPGL